MKNKSIVIWVVLTGLILSLLFNCKKETVKTAPLVSILEVPTVNGTSAIIKIEIAADGGAVVSERGICWGTNENPTINDSKVIASNGGDITGIKKIKAGIVSDNSTALTGDDNVVTLTDLLPNTNYYIRAYAINSVGVGYSSQTTLKTLALAPVLTTSALTVVSSSSVSSGGEITYDGGDSITARGVCWSTNQNPTIADLKTSDGKGKGSFTSVITGLTLGSTYYFRAYATNSAGTSYGNQVTTAIGANLPVITTSTASVLTTTTATSGGNITSDGGSPVTARGVCWNTNPTQLPTILDSKTTDGTGLGSFTSTLTGLSPYHTYIIRAYATNSNGTSYGAGTSISISIPALTIMPASEITTTTATFGCKILSNGGFPITASGVCWSTSQYPTISNSKTTDGTGSGNFTSIISGLNPGATYYVRAYATNSLGTGYSSSITITTASSIPVVTTKTVTVYTFSAKSGGNVVSSGGGTLISGICWSKNPNPTISDSKVNNLYPYPVTNYYSYLSGLDPNTTYYVRAFATNSIGTG